MTNAIETRKDELMNQTKMALNKILAQHGSNYNNSKLKNTAKEFLVDDIINYEFPSVENTDANIDQALETEKLLEEIEEAEKDALNAGTEHGLDSDEVILAEGKVSDLILKQHEKEIKAKKVEVAKVKETEAVKKNGPVSTEELFDQPLVTKEEVKEEKKSKKSKKEPKEKVHYNPIFESIQNALSEIKIDTFEGKNPKRCYLRCNTGNKDFWWVIALSQSRTQLELCGTDLDKLFQVHAEVAKNWKSISFHHKDGAKRAKIYIEIENHDAEEIAKKWKNFETKVGSKLKTKIEVK